MSSAVAPHGVQPVRIRKRTSKVCIATEGGNWIWGASCRFGRCADFVVGRGPVRCFCRREAMPDRLTSNISIPAPIITREKCIIQERGYDRSVEIEALDADNFELRNQITRLKLHNAALRGRDGSRESYRSFRLGGGRPRASISGMKPDAGSQPGGRCATGFLSRRGASAVVCRHGAGALTLGYGMTRARPIGHR
jgi:hypothetical protein